MPSASTTDMLTGRRALDALARALDRVTVVFSIVGTMGILAIMVLIVADVIARTGLERPLAGIPEIVSMSILGIVFLQLPNTVARGQLTRSDMLLTTLEARAPRTALVLDALLHCIGAAVIAVLIWAFLPLFLRSWSRNEMVGTIGQFMAPLWPVHGIVLAGSVLLFAVLAMRMIALATLAAEARS